MQIVHLDECHSTQEYLKNQFEEGHLSAPALVYTHNQTSGRGRRNKVWHHFQGSLAFSFVTPAFEPITFSPLSVGVLLCKSFEERGVSLKLKWPNDLLNEGKKKVGGILSEVYRDGLILCGVGINLYPTDQKKFDFPHDFIFKNKESFNSEEFFESFLKQLGHRDINFLNEWNSRCAHRGELVKIVDQESSVEGIFEGLGENGEALVKTSQGLERVFTGSLRFLEDGNKN